MSEAPFQKRLHLTAILFLLCAAVIFLRALQVGYFSRDKYLQIGNKLSLRHITLPARRGEIRDKNNVKLVWNERQFDLYLTRSPEKLSPDGKNKLRSFLPKRTLRFESNQPVCLRLTAEETSRLEPLIKSGFPIKIRSVIRRKKLNHPYVLARAGNITNGTGTSGWEAQYNKTLQGIQGAARVTLDRRRNWIPGSWDLYKSPVHGQDAVLPIDIKQMPSPQEVKK